MKNIQNDKMVIVGREGVFNESVFCNISNDEITDEEVAKKLFVFFNKNVSGSVFKELKKCFKGVK